MPNVEALMHKCEKKDNIFDDGELGKSPFTKDVLDARIQKKFKTPAMKP